MRYSLNEAEAMAKKAARGAGYDWGLAEEAGQATRWLCFQGLDGVSSLVRVLREFGGGSGNPILVGTLINDRAEDLRDGSMAFNAVSGPALVLPFAAMAAKRIGCAVQVRLGSITAITDGDKLALTDDRVPTVADIAIEKAAALNGARQTSWRATPAEKDWEALTALAGRTYAPATEESRRLGAG